MTKDELDSLKEQIDYFKELVQNKLNNINDPMLDFLVFDGEVVSMNKEEGIIDTMDVVDNTIDLLTDELDKKNKKLKKYRRDAKIIHFCYKNFNRCAIVSAIVLLAAAVGGAVGVALISAFSFFLSLAGSTLLIEPNVFSDANVETCEARIEEIKSMLDTLDETDDNLTELLTRIRNKAVEEINKKNEEKMLSKVTCIEPYVIQNEKEKDNRTENNNKGYGKILKFPGKLE